MCFQTSWLSLTGRTRYDTNYIIISTYRYECLGTSQGWGLQDGAGVLAKSFPNPAAAPQCWGRGPWGRSQLDNLLYRPTRPPPGSADSSGLRPHEPTLKERSRLNSPVGTNRVAAQAANVCTMCALLCDGPASSVSSNFPHTFEFPDPQLRPRRCSTPKSRSGAKWDSENRILNPKWFQKHCPKLPKCV